MVQKLLRAKVFGLAEKESDTEGGGGVQLLPFFKECRALRMPALDKDAALHLKRELCRRPEVIETPLARRMKPMLANRLRQASRGKRGEEAAGGRCCGFCNGWLDGNCGAFCNRWRHAMKLRGQLRLILSGQKMCGDAAHAAILFDAVLPMARSMARDGLPLREMKWWRVMQ